MSLEPSEVGPEELRSSLVLSLQFEDPGTITGHRRTYQSDEKRSFHAGRAAPKPTLVRRWVTPGFGFSERAFG